MFPFLTRHGVLGLNARNLLYIKPFNPKKAIALADSKLKTKAYLEARGIPVAKIYAKIETREQIHAFDFKQLPDSCVLKPNFGFGGEGIIILKGRNRQGQFLKNGKDPITEEELREHCEDILDGMYSLGGRRDIAFFEQILTPHECFARFRPAGLPDIRVIVFNLVPVMAMLRIPTAESDGKANVHLGGMGIGLDIAKGVTTHAAQYHRMITELPHGGSPAGIKLPYWDEILSIASRIQYITNIGYLAADITIDEARGPLVLEVNARAGLMVQVANLAPLRARLERVEGLTVSSPEKGVRIGQDLFGEKVATHRETQGKPVLGLRETLHISGIGATIDVPARIDLKEERTVFAPDLIEELRAQDAVEAEEGGTFRVKFTLGGTKIQTAVTAGDVAGPERAVIGRRNLGEFLIDATKKPSRTKQATVKSNLPAVDTLLGQIDRDLLLLKELKPMNLEEERQRAQEDRLYNPIFTYPATSMDLDAAEERLSEPVRDDSPLGILLEKKRGDLLKRVALLRARGDAAGFTRASAELFGMPDTALLAAAEEALRARTMCDLPLPDDELLSAEETAERFEEALARYSLHDWQVTIRPRLVADVTVGGKKIYVRRDARFAEPHVAALIAHEIETHVLTAENGEHQPFMLLRRGCAGYLDTQEGLAIFNQNRILSQGDERRFNPPRNVLGVAFGLEHSFARTRQYLEEELGYTPQKALTQAITIKRGLSNTSEKGGFTKGLVYFRGLRAIEKFVVGGGNLKRLYVGRIALPDLELVEKIPDLQQPLLVPGFLRT